MEKWFNCPYCGQKILKYDESQAISNALFIKCKGKNCGKTVEIKIRNYKN